MVAASRDISACSARAVSHVGGGIIVASGAKTRRPRAPCAVEGQTARTRSRNASISGLDETGAGVCGEFLAMDYSTLKPCVPADRQMARSRPKYKLVRFTRRYRGPVKAG